MDELTKILEKTLIEIEDINNEIYTKTSFNEINIIFNKIKEYEEKLTHIKKLTETASNIHNNIKIIFTNTVLKRNKDINSNAMCPIENGHIKKKNKEIILYKNISNIENNNNIEYFKTPVIAIAEKNIDSIVNTPIYFIKNTNEYALKINGNVIRGNIGNVYKHNDTKKKIHKCRKSNCDQKFFNRECNYFHKNDNRNYAYYSWNHINGNKMNSTKFDKENTRFLGSLDTLHTDLAYTDINEKELRNSQLMHDILIYNILNNYLI